MPQHVTLQECIDTDMADLVTQFAGCHFTSASPGYNANLTLTVTWCNGGDPKMPPPSIKWKLVQIETLIS